MTAAEAKVVVAATAASLVRDVLADNPDSIPFDTKEEHELIYSATVELVVELFGRAGVRCCHVCGCTEDAACDNDGRPCSWAAPDLCSAHGELSRIVVVSG